MIIWEGVCNLKRRWSQERVGFWRGWVLWTLVPFAVPWAVLLLRVTLPLFAFGIICSPHQSTWISWADSTPHSQGGRDSAGHTDWFRARTYFTGWVNETEV